MNDPAWKIFLRNSNVDPEAKNYTKDLKGKKSNKLPINCLYRQYFNTRIPSIEEDQFKI